MAPLTLVLLFVAAALGGALNSVAGGGSFIAFPALLFAGVPPVSANATNTIALWPGGVASAVAYRREAPRDRASIVTLAGTSFVGGILGATLLLKTRESTFTTLIPWLLLGATLLFTFGKRIAALLPKNTRAPLGVVAAIQIVIAIYGGYFGGGMSILMLAVLPFLGMTNIHEMNALKTILGAAINGIAVVLFVLAGAVAWQPGVVMIAGGITGGYAGAALARRLDPARVRTFVLIVAWGLSLWFFYATYLRGGR